MFLQSFFIPSNLACKGTTFFAYMQIKRQKSQKTYDFLQFSTKNLSPTSPSRSRGNPETIPNQFRANLEPLLCRFFRESEPNQSRDNPETISNQFRDNLGVVKSKAPDCQTQTGSPTRLCRGGESGGIGRPSIERSGIDHCDPIAERDRTRQQRSLSCPSI